MNVCHGLIQFATAPDDLGATLLEVLTFLPLLLRLVAHIWEFTRVQSRSVHLPDQFANLRLTLDNLVLSLLVSNCVILQLLGRHDRVLTTELCRCGHS